MLGWIGMTKEYDTTGGGGHVGDIRSDQILCPIELRHQTVFPFGCIEDIPPDQIQSNKECPLVSETEILFSVRLSGNVEGVIPVPGFEKQKFFFPILQPFIGIGTIVPIVVPQQHKDWNGRLTQNVGYLRVFFHVTNQIVTGIAQISHMYDKVGRRRHVLNLIHKVFLLS